LPEAYWKESSGFMDNKTQRPCLDKGFACGIQVSSLRSFRPGGTGILEYWNDGMVCYGEMVKWVIGKIHIDREVQWEVRARWLCFGVLLLGVLGISSITPPLQYSIVY
jgi:hypothetical protein